jgi:hypothetical protein
MVSPDQADREEQLADVQGTEQRMHSAADLLPDSELVHERADQLSARAQQHRRRAQRLREAAGTALMLRSTADSRRISGTSGNATRPGLCRRRTPGLTGQVENARLRNVLRQAAARRNGVVPCDSGGFSSGFVVSAPLTRAS